MQWFGLLTHKAQSLECPCNKCNFFSPLLIAAQVVLGNGGVVGEDRAEILTGKMDWSSVSLESADKKESNEISGHRERTSQHRSLLLQ